MGGCTWHTVAAGSSTSPILSSGSGQRSGGGPGSGTVGGGPILLSPQLPQQGDMNNGGNPLASLTQQMHMALMMQNSNGDYQSMAMQMTEVLLNTVSGINTLRNAVGDEILGEFLSLLLKDGSDNQTSAANGMAYMATSNSVQPPGPPPPMAGGTTGGGARQQHLIHPPPFGDEVSTVGQSYNLPVGLLDN